MHTSLQIPKNVIECVLNLAPHQSWDIESSEYVEGYSIDHDKDAGSGGRMKGVRAAFQSDVGKDLLGSHSISSFTKELGAFMKAFQEGGKRSDKVINSFINKMKSYGIKVTVRE